MIPHICKYTTYYEEYYGEHVMDGWPPRCSQCGKFMKWPAPVKSAATEFEALFNQETQDEESTQS